MVLPYQTILSRCNLPHDAPDDAVGSGGLVDPCQKSGVRTASYDLRLGTHFFPADYDGARIKVEKLDSADSATLRIPANGVVICECLERVKLPNDIAGHLSLKMDLLLAGLFMANQGQLDAGYCGHVFVLLYNLSNADLFLQYGQRIVRLEFAMLTTPTGKTYTGSYQGISLATAWKTPFSSGLFSVRKELANLRSKLNWVSVAGAVVVAAVTALNFFGPLASKVGSLETKIALESQLASMKEQLKSMSGEMAALRQRLEPLSVPPTSPDAGASP